MSAPDLIEAVIGYRQWRSPGNTLRGLIEPTPWPPGETMTAACRYAWRKVDHDDVEAPRSDCSCGLYAWHDRPLQAVGDANRMVLGAIKAWGRIEVHHGGFRAQHAQIIALAGAGRRVAWLAGRYGVPAVPADRLAAFASEHGTPVPDALRPDAPTEDDRWNAVRYVTHHYGLRVTSAFGHNQHNHIHVPIDRISAAWEAGSDPLANARAGLRIAAGRHDPNCHCARCSIPPRPADPR